MNIARAARIGIAIILGFTGDQFPYKIIECSGIKQERTLVEPLEIRLRILHSCTEKLYEVKIKKVHN